MQTLNRQGYTIRLDDSPPGDREVTYQIVDGPDPTILDSDPVLVDCGSFADLERIASRALDIKLGRYASHPDPVNAPTPSEVEPFPGSESPESIFPHSVEQPESPADWEEKPAPEPETSTETVSDAETEKSDESQPS